jgi:hypothetical protein
MDSALKFPLKSPEISAMHCTGSSAPPIQELTSSPKPPLAFRVGIVGHRPNRLQGANLEKLCEVFRKIMEAVEAEVREVEESQRDLFVPDAPALRAVSPLAEGKDRLFADQALGLGSELCCVLAALRTRSGGQRRKMPFGEAQ